MRQRRSRRWLALLAVAVALPRGGAAQGTEGGLFLLSPIGARAVGMGQAVVAAPPTSEAVWWNPASIARAEKREAAIHHSQTIVATADAISLVVPWSLVGVVAASTNIVDYGEIEQTDAFGTIGVIRPRNYVFAATYATSLGDRASAGITYKIVQFRIHCSGSCGLPSSSASTSALDFGAQYDFSGIAPVQVGMAVRNVGLRLQAKDAEQADPLPTRLQAGATYRIVPFEAHVPRGEMRVAGVVVGELPLRAPSARLGAELALDRKFFFRGGYVFDDSEGAGPSIGLGLSTQSLFLDLAYMFEGFSADAGRAPTFVSLRVLF